MPCRLMQEHADRSEQTSETASSYGTGRNRNPTLSRCFVEGPELRKRRAAKNLPLCANCWESREGRVELFSLQRLAVGLVNANESPDEVYVFLIRKGAVTRRPG